MTRQQITDAPLPQWSPYVWLSGSDDDRDIAPDEAADMGDEASLAGRIIMIVEDETIVAMDIKFAVEDAGGTVLGPFTGLGEAQAFLSYFEGQIDAAVLDINLRGEMVFPLATALENRGVPFLFHTANTEMPQLKTTFAAHRVCNKPAKTETLIEAIASIIP